MHVLHIGPEPSTSDSVAVGVALYENETDGPREWISLVHGWYYADKRLLYIGEVDTVERYRRQGIALELLVQLVDRFDVEVVDAARTTEASENLFWKLGERLPSVQIVAP